MGARRWTHTVARSHGRKDDEENEVGSEGGIIGEAAGSGHFKQERSRMGRGNPEQSPEQPENVYIKTVCSKLHYF